MLSSQLRTRLSQVSRIRPDAIPRSVCATPKQWQDLSYQSSQPRWDLSRGQEVSNSIDTHWIVDKPLEVLWPVCSKTLSKYEPQLKLYRIGKDVHSDLMTLARGFSASAIYLDIEFCGFGSAMVFLVGVIYQK